LLGYTVRRRPGERRRGARTRRSVGALNERCTLTAAIIGTYVLVVGYLGATFRTGGNLAISLIATGIVAVLFQPKRGRLQRAANRLVYGERDDPYAVLSRLGRRLEATLVPEATLEAIVETVAEALKSPYSGVSHAAARRSVRIPRRSTGSR
jgi:hypothetical protein